MPGPNCGRRVGHPSARGVAASSISGIGVAVLILVPALARAGAPGPVGGAVEGCIAAADPAWAEAAADHDLGCAVGEPYGTGGSQQAFQHGQMLWREDAGSIYVLLSHRWDVHGDEFRPGEPERTGLAPPGGDLREPGRGFGKRWWAEGGPSAPIGWATSDERAFHAVVQEFERGIIVRTDLDAAESEDAASYVLRLGGAPATARLPPPMARLPTFPFGVFEDFNASGDPARVEAIINDLRPRGFNAIMWANGSVARQEAALAVADRLGFDMLLGPAAELDAHWWSDPSAPETLAEARALVYPLVDRLKGHPSLRGYYIADEPPLALQRKVELAARAFRERDPARPAFAVLVGTDRVAHLYAAAGRGPLVIDVYPVSTHNGACDFGMTGFGYPGLDFVDYVRAVTATKPADAPLWMVLQAHGLRAAGLREPSAEEVRKQFWLAVGEGAQGVFWFVYSSQQGWTGLADNPALYAEVTAIARRTGALRGELTGARRVADRFDASGGTYTSTLASADGARVYAVVVNPACGPQEVAVTSVDGGVGRLQDVESGRVYGLGEALPLAGGDGRLLKLLPAR